MSATDDDGEEIPVRETAYRLFAAEYDDATLSYAESDEERAPNYVISPTGARLNRVFVVGTLTEVTSVNDEMVRARVVDPTGAFVVYAGQYQPDELATLETLEAPEFVAVTGKARTFQPDDSEQVYTSLRPESIATVDAATRDRWVVSSAERTLERIGTYAAAAGLETVAESQEEGDDAVTDALRAAGVENGLAAGIPLARDHYGTTPAYLAALRDRAREAVEVVAGRRDQVTARSFGPAGSSPDYESASFESLAARSDVDPEGLAASLSAESSAGTDADSPDSQPVQATTATASAGSESESDPDVGSGSEVAGTDDTGSAAGTATGTDADASSAVEASDAGVEATPETDAGDDDLADSDDEAGEDELGDFDTEADDEDREEFDDDSGMYEMDDEEREQLEEEFGAEFSTGSEVDEPGSADIDVPEPDEETAVDDAAESDVADDAETATDVPADDGDDPAGDDLGAPPESGLEADSEAEPDSDAVASTSGAEPDTARSEPGDDVAETVDAEPEPGDEEDEAGESDDADEADEDPLADVDLQEYVVETMSELDDGDGADRATLVETVADDTDASEDEIEDAIQDALMSGQCYEPGDDRLTAI